MPKSNHNKNPITLFAVTNYRDIKKIFGIKEKNRRGHMYLIGKTGTGKTIVTKFVLERLKRKAEVVGAPVLISYVNCRMAGSNYRVLAELCRSIRVDIPFTGLALGEVIDRFKNGLNTDRTALIVVLDEIDALVKGRQDDSLLYELTRINESLSQSWIGKSSTTLLNLSKCLLHCRQGLLQLTIWDTSGFNGV